MRPSHRVLLLVALDLVALGVAPPLFAQGVPPTSSDDVEWDSPPDVALPEGVEYRTFRSASMEQEVGYLIFRPTTESEGPLRVLYWLRGTDSYASDLSIVDLVATSIAEGTVEPMAIVLANGAPAAGYLDNPATGIMGESVVIRELLPHVEESFGIGGTQGSRGIGGIGIGGGAAVRLTLRNPDIFGTIVSLGGAMTSAPEIEELHGVPAAVAAGADPFALSIEVAPRLRSITTYLRAGGDDPWIAANRRFAAHLGHQNLDVDYRELPGVGETLDAYLDAIGTDLVRFVDRNLD